MNEKYNGISPLISVIVPVYNIMDCLERCVKSICNQTYENLEIILVDDGSTDGTDKLCDELAKTDVRIRVFHKENGGSSSARNMGIDASRGTYLGFVDSDDYIEPRMYETLYAQIQRTGMQIAQIARHEIAEDGTELPPVCFAADTDYAYPSVEFLTELLMHRGDCSFCTKLVEKSLFRRQKFPLGVLNEDFNLLVHMLGVTRGVASSPLQMYDVYYRTGSNTRKKSREDFSRVYADCVDNADMVYDLVSRTYPDLIPVALRFNIFQRLEYLLHIPISQMTRENQQYRDIVSYMRKHLISGLTNKILTGKNKAYLLLFSIAPRSLRVIHKKFK
ncbi:MAG: glycosyltransferase [Lachnospiraceae bacterium]|nr:glycosyltransferase [Lachnospiraceae bacterium]